MIIGYVKGLWFLSKSSETVGELYFPFFVLLCYRFVYVYVIISCKMKYIGIIKVRISGITKVGIITPNIRNKLCGNNQTIRLLGHPSCYISQVLLICTSVHFIIQHKKLSQRTCA